MQGRADAPPYRHVAWCYDALASWYSLGAIDRAKRVHLDLIRPGDRVLYVGAGSGREVIAALRRGASVVCVEPDSAMASRLSKRTAGHREHTHIDQRPIQSIQADPAYDVVVAHFFLNIFDHATMPGVLAHLTAFVKPGGRLVIADFKPAPANAGVLGRALRWLYYRPVNLAGRLLRICALHPIYDYAALLPGHGFTIESCVRAGNRGVPKCYHTIVAHR